ncbi:hypothetical protein BJX70DRAFT_357798 [Aspergillus crustosus]
MGRFRGGTAWPGFSDHTSPVRWPSAKLEVRSWLSCASGAFTAVNYANSIHWQAMISQLRLIRLGRLQWLIRPMVRMFIIDLMGAADYHIRVH